MVGLIKNVAHHCSSGFKGEGDIVFLLGGPCGDESLGSSEYLQLIHGKVTGSQQIDIDTEKRLHDCVIKACERGLLKSAHDCSDGGLAVALAESCILGNIGFTGKVRFKGRLDAALFGEAQSRVIVSVSRSSANKLESLAYQMSIPLTRLGTTGGADLVLKGLMDLPVSDLLDAWWNTL
jgi:phosphoribosylformylglycinamidine synthase